MYKDFSKFTDDAIDFAFNESNKLMQETLVSFREVTNRSYVAFAAYASVMAYFMEREESDWINVLMVVCAILSMSVCWRNLMPIRMSMSGTYPKDMIHEFYATQDKQLREMRITKLHAFANGIDMNVEEVLARCRRFRVSVVVMTASLILHFVIGLFN